MGNGVSICKEQVDGNANELAFRTSSSRQTATRVLMAAGSHYARANHRDDR